MTATASPDLLATIVAATRRIAETRAREAPLAELEQRYAALSRRPDGAAFIAAITDGPRPRIIAERETVAFDSADVEIDVLAARRLGAGGAAPTILAESAALFRGAFLEGLELPSCPEFETWRAAEREEARVLHCRVLKDLIGALAARPLEALPHARAISDPGSPPPGRSPPPSAEGH